jgi:hypothetical protein
LDILLRPAFGRAAFPLLMVACSSPASKQACPRHEAAFRVELTAEAATIPQDTAIEVTYQGSEMETFSLHRAVHNQDVCCRLGSPTSGALPSVPCNSVVEAGAARPTDAASVQRVDAGDAGGGAPESAPDTGTPTALFCELWTNGPATVHVTASGYAVIDRDLLSKLREDECGVSTVDVRLALVHPDGGKP